MISRKTTHILIIYTAIFILSLNQELFAQLDLPVEGGVDDVPEAPINGFIAIALAIGSYFGIRRLRK